MTTKKLKILLIEDDTIEIMKMKRTLSRFNHQHELIESHNGEDALGFLNKAHYLPDLILLDLNMPKINGIEFLTFLKSDPKLKYIPTIVLTTSRNDRDLHACYNLGIAGYLLKPLKYEDYVVKLKRLFDYWSVNEFYSVQ